MKQFTVIVTHQRGRRETYYIKSVREWTAAHRALQDFFDSKFRGANPLDRGRYVIVELRRTR